MPANLVLTPQDNNYLTSRIVYNQLIQNSPDFLIDEENVTTANPTKAQVLLDGSGRAQLDGAVTITGTPAAGMTLGHLPNHYKPKSPTVLLPVAVLRGTAYVSNAILVQDAGSPITGITVTLAGSYTTAPTLTATAPGFGATLAPISKAVTVTAIANAGTGYAPADTITLTGGTFAGATVLTVASTKLSSAALNAAGSGYLTGDTVTLAGGTATTKAIITVAGTKLVSTVLNALGSGYATGNTITLAGGTHSAAAVLTLTSTKLASAAINAAGTGYVVNDTITLAGGTFSTAAVVTVNTVNGGGGILTFTITNRGVYTANTATFTQGSTSGTGTGATFNTALYGVNAFTVSTGGAYTVEASSLTQASSSGAGTGATFQTSLYGVGTATISNAGVYTANATNFTQFSTSGGGSGVTLNTTVYALNAVTISTPGAYTVLPSNPVSQGSSSGSGTGATFTMAWGLLGAVVSAGGSGYTSASGLSVSPSGPTGTLDLGLSVTGEVSLVTSPNSGDVVYLNSAPILLESYN